MAIEVIDAQSVTQRPPEQITGVFLNNSNYLREAGTNSISLVRLEDLGLRSFDQARVISKMVGNSSRNLMDIMAQLTQTPRTFTPINTEIRQWRQGVDLFATGTVVNTVTGNASSLPSIQITVTGPGGVNTAWYSMGALFRGRDGRNYEVFAISENASGQQVLSIRPVNGIADLVVTGGESTAFPNDFSLTEIGIGANTSCTYDISQRQWNTTESYNRMSRNQRQFTRNATQTNNNFAAIVKGIPGYEGGVIAYLSHQEMLNYFEGAKQVSSRLLWDQENVNADAIASCGNGLIAQIPDTYKLNMPLTTWKRDAFGFISSIMRDWTSIINPNYISNEVIMACGSNAYYDLQQSLAASGNASGFVQWRDVPTSSSNALSGLSAGSKYETLTMALGDRVVKIVHIDALDDPSLSGDGRDLYTGQASIHSHDVLLIDPGMKRNKSLDSEGMVDENEYKIGLFCQANVNGEDMHFTHVFKPGLVDEEGAMITRGQVVDFDPKVTHKMDWTFMPTLEQDDAIVHISPVY